MNNDPKAPTERRCRCGHTVGQHELRSGGRLGCYIWGCNCIDFEEARS